MSWLCPAFWSRDSNIYLEFSAFTSRPTTLLASVDVSVFFIISICYVPVDSHHQHRPAADGLYLLFLVLFNELSYRGSPEALSILIRTPLFMAPFLHCYHVLCYCDCTGEYSVTDSFLQLFQNIMLSSC
jgi:hypothetical protein